MTDKNDLLQTGIFKMDQQHKEIFLVAQSLSDAFQTLQTKEALLPICNRLFNVCRQHFDEEERLMLKFFYPHTEAHIGLHMDHTIILANLINNIKSDAYSDAMDTLAYLIKWHEDHISDADQHYADYISPRSL